MNKIIGIIGLTLVFSACGGNSEEHKTATPTKEMTKEEAKIDETINQIDAIEKDIQAKEEDLNKALKDLEGM